MHHTLPMLPWHTTRYLLLLALLVPLAHFGWRVSSDYQQLSDLAPTTWEPQVQAFEALDANTPPPKRPILVLGGRQAALWQSLTDTLFPMDVLNRGLGDANLDDLQHYLERIANPYQPLAVLFIPSATDFVVRADKSAAQFLQSTAALCAQLHQLPSNPHCYVMTLPKWPAYPQAWPRVERSNELLSFWTEANVNASLIDTRPILLDANGDTIGSYFRNDGHILNDWGTQKISPLIREQVELDFPFFF